LPPYAAILPAQDLESQFWSQQQAGGAQQMSEIEAARAQLGSGVGRRVFEEVLPQADSVQHALATARDAEWRASDAYKQQYEAAGGAASGWLPPMV